MASKRTLQETGDRNVQVIDRKMNNIEVLVQKIDIEILASNIHVNLAVACWRIFVARYRLLSAK